MQSLRGLSSKLIRQSQQLFVNTARTIRCRTAVVLCQHVDGPVQLRVIELLVHGLGASRVCVSTAFAVAAE
eukprot:11383-Heterococcus_DN1.PRE.3